MRRALAISVLIMMATVPVAQGRPDGENVSLLVPATAGTGAFETQEAADSRTGWKRITVPVDGSVEHTRRSLERDLGTTVVVERSYSLLGGEDEPLFDQQWPLNNSGQQDGTPDADIDIEAAWEVSTGSGVVVAVIDSGVAPDHPELEARIWKNPREEPNGVDDDQNGKVDDVFGWDFEDRDRDPSPDGDSGDEAHATFIAGIIAAEVNGEGIAGVAPDARIMNLRACSEGSCLTLDVSEAIHYAADSGADIINLSFGMVVPEGESDLPLEQAIEHARQEDVLVVTAAGNTSPDLLEGFVILPATMPHANNVSVASTDHNDRLDQSSYYGDNIDIAAPGVDVLSASLAGYAVGTGTSYAAPHVAGVAALLLATDRSMGHEELAARIKAWVDRPADVVGKVESGRLNAGAVLNNQFVDAIGSTFRSDIGWLADEAIARGCDPPQNIMFCPGDPVTRGQMAAFINRYLSLPATSTDYFGDDNDSVFQEDINRLAEAGVTRGCNPPANDEFCPGEPVTREQMAAFLVRALNLAEADHPGFEDVAESNTFAGDIARLAAAGVTRGCNPPANTLFCPGEPVTRGQMSAFLHRSE